MPGRVGAIVLAAGASRRMGRCKPLLPLPDGPAVVRLIRTLRAGGAGEILVVVAPPHGDAVAAAVGTLAVSVVRNPDPGSDMAGSARAGLSAATPRPDAFLVCPADHPLVRESTVSALIAAHAEMPDRIAIPVHSGRRGHPVLFPREALDELAFLATLRDVVRRDPARVLPVPVEDPGILADLDTPEDYERSVGRPLESSAE